MYTFRLLLFLSLSLGFQYLFSQSIDKQIQKNASAIEQQVIEWRRYLHANPELSNREFKTAEMIAEHLESLGMEVHTRIAHTGVVGVLKGGKEGPTIGLRADMDALPVKERVDVPFKSTVTTEYRGEEVGVMHACGHDTHVAILLGAAQVLSKMQPEISGTIVFVFQPAEEGPPEGEEGGAPLMIKEGLFKDFGIEVMFGLHINSQTEVGTIAYKPGPAMASASTFFMTVHGKQTHGSSPWTGVDPVVVGAQIIQGLQTIVSRQSELTKAPVVITVGKIRAGVRENIIPEKLEMSGTIRVLDPEVLEETFDKIRRTADHIAKSAGATVDVEINTSTLVTYNNLELTKKMLPSLAKSVGEDNLHIRPWTTGAEDFSFYAAEVPSLFFVLGGMPKGQSPKEAAPHHTPDFYIDDSELDAGVRAFCHLVFDYAASPLK